MKYYRIKFSSNRITEIGCYPQAEEVKLIAYNTNEITTKQSEIDGLIPPEPILNKHAKPTTLMDAVSINSNIFFLFNRLFIEFLEQFNIGHYQIWPIKIHHKKELLNDYVLFHISQPSDSKYIDFANSKFRVGRQWIWENQSVGKPAEIADHGQYLNLLETLKEEDRRLNIQCEKLVFDFSSASEDFIRFAELPQAGYYVSQRLKNSILKRRFTGIDFIPIEKYSKRFEVINLSG